MKDAARYSQAEQLCLAALSRLTWLLLSAALFFGCAFTAVAQASPPKYLHTAWTTEHGLPQNSITSILQTRDGYLWIATFGGLARFDGVKFTIFDAGNSPGLRSNRILCLYEDREGGLWMGTEQGGVTRFFQGGFTTWTRKDGLPDDSVRGFYQDRQGDLWVNSQGGLARLRAGRFAAEAAYFGFPRDKLGYFFETGAGDIWLEWMETNELARFRDGQLTLYPFTPNLLCEFDDGSVWVYDRPRHQLARFRDGVMTPYPLERELPRDQVVNFFVGRDDSACFLTPRGVVRLDRFAIERTVLR